MEPTKVSVIPRMRRIIYTTYAAFPTTGLKVGDLAYASDKKDFIVGMVPLGK